MNDIKEIERILSKGLSNTKLSDIIMQVLIKLIISNAFYKPITNEKLVQLLQLVNDIEELIDDELERGLKITERDLL
jgi:phosphoribosylaminoimidazole-succinocarboxamide synthase